MKQLKFDFSDKGYVPSFETWWSEILTRECNMEKNHIPKEKP